MPTNVRDPRTIITPDAFGISPDLLGTPLAGPWRRFWAILVDLLLIGILSAMLEQRGFLIWGTVGLFLVWMAFRRGPSGASQALSVMLRGATGCLGVTVLLFVGAFWFAFSLAEDAGRDFEETDVEAVVEESLGGALRTTLGSVDAGRRLSRAETAGEAEEAAADLARITAEAGIPRDERLEVLLQMTPDDPPWTDSAEVIYRRVLARYDVEARAEAEEATRGAGTTEAAAPEVAALSDAEALRAYAELVDAGSLPDTGAAASRARALRRRAAALSAADTLEELAEEIDDLRDDLEDEEEARREAEATLEEEGAGLVALARDIWEQLGSAIGLWSIYFTVLLTVFNGQTVGKRLLGLRVLRLDGEPMSWWYAFERGGGYVAGLATGLLGFAQIFWDPNRQCVHDKIVGTVVVDEKAGRVPGAWKEAWSDRSAGGGSEGSAGRGGTRDEEDRTP